MEPSNRMHIYYPLALVILLMVLLALGGCSQHATGSFLPDIKTYSPAFQKGMKAEMPTVRACCPKTNQFVKDSVQLRDKIRAGNKVQDKQTGGGIFRNFLKR